jgi:hypothetical protein
MTILRTQLESGARPRRVVGARGGHRHLHTTFAIESNDSPAPGIMPEPVRVHNEPAATTTRRGDRQATRLRFRGRDTRDSLAARNPRNEPTRLEAQ